jgi:hypothetical protein
MLDIGTRRSRSTLDACDFNMVLNAAMRSRSSSIEGALVSSWHDAAAAGSFSTANMTFPPMVEIRVLNREFRISNGELAIDKNHAR